MRSEVHQPRLLRASAGTGKTFALSSHFIRLLLLGESPDRILASTFTRKAAGEIRDRIIQRLVQATSSTEAAHSLARECEVSPVGADRITEVLSQLMRKQHRLLIGTFDSLFMRIAKLFAHELHIPPDWRMHEEDIDRHLVDNAIQQLCQSEDLEILIALIRLVSGDKLRRMVHGRFVDSVRALYPLLADGASACWGFREPPPEPSSQRLREVIASLRALPEGTTKAGKPSPALESLRAATVLTVQEGLWDKLLDGAAVRNIRDGNFSYKRMELPPEWVQCLREVEVLARHEAAYELQQKTLGYRHLVSAFAKLYERFSSQRGLYSLHAIKVLLRESGRLGSIDALYARLDRSIRHVLLDEFQDTSPLEWSIIHPLVDEVLSTWGAERTFLCVGDLKQAIYGWRGGSAQILEQIPAEWPQVAVESMTKSRRCSEAVLSLVNQVFRQLPQCEPLRSWETVVARWRARFEPHESLVTSATGEARVVSVPSAHDAADDATPYDEQMMLETVQGYLARAPQASVGVLVRTNESVRRFVAALRDSGVAASEEGGVPLVSSRVVQAVCSLLQLIVHPGDSAAFFHLHATPLGRHAGVPARASELSPFSREARVAIARSGLGEYVAPLLRSVESVLTATERERSRQLVELIFRFESEQRGTIEQFLVWIAEQKVRDVRSEQVRVMTVHQSKGLEFDVVVLPDLADEIGSNFKDKVLAERDPISGAYLQILAIPGKGLRDAHPEAQRLYAERMARDIDSALSVLYVALTRARWALTLLVPADPKPLSMAGVVTAALPKKATAAPDEAELSGTLWEEGGSGWEPQVHGTSVSLRTVEVPVVNPPIPTAQRRFFHRVSPSQSGRREGAVGREAPQSGALIRGKLLHLFFSLVRWREDGLPAFDLFRGLALTVAPPPGLNRDRTIRSLFDEGVRIVGNSVIGALFSRAYYPGELQCEVLTECSVAMRVPEGLMVGSIDRLVLLRGAAGDVRGAHLVDFKSGGGASMSLVSEFAAQVEAYRLAVADRFRIPRVAIRASLASIGSDSIIDLER